MDGLTAVRRIMDEVRSLTMTSESVLGFTIAAAVECIERNIPGVLVECGTWKGGSSFAMLLAQRYMFGKVMKPVWMLDSFQGLPPPDERDGPMALEWQPLKHSATYHYNCAVSVEEIIRTRDAFGFDDTEAVIVPGWFKDTLPPNLESLANSGIALLRIDCDWYDPVSLVLDMLMPCVSDEASVIMDDYYAWDGCARATHDFLARNCLSYRIRSMPGFEAAWFEKRAARTGSL